MRFCALRLYESGLIKSNPKKIIAEKTDWRFFNELKRELKARTKERGGYQWRRCKPGVAF
jgi:hypothetical protein